MNLIDLFQKLIDFGSPPSAPAAGNLLPDRSADQAILVREGYTIQRLPAAHPTRPPREHAFDAAPSLVAWVRRYWPCPLTVETFVSSGRIMVSSGNDYWSDLVSCRLLVDPVVTRWQEEVFRGQVLDQKALHRWLSRHQEYIEGGEALVAKLRAVEISRTGSVAGRLSERGDYELVAATKGQDISVKLPPTFTLTVPWYVGLETRYDVIVHLDMLLAEGGPPRFQLDAENLEEVQDAALTDMLTYLEKALNDGIEGEQYQVYRGTWNSQR